LCSSPWIVGETERALLRPRNMNRYRYRPEDVRQFLGGLARSAQFFRDAPQVPAVTRDPSDDQVIACAVAARAEYLVMGDDDMLVLSEHQGIRIVTPRQFLDLLDASGAG
jgi:predicted nucleic acid-binding protein